MRGLDDEENGRTGLVSLEQIPEMQAAAAQAVPVGLEGGGGVPALVCHKHFYMQIVVISFLVVALIKHFTLPETFAGHVAPVYLTAHSTLALIAQGDLPKPMPFQNLMVLWCKRLVIPWLNK